MEFVSLLNGKDDVLSAYSYCKRGTDIPYNPDKIREQAELSSYNYESGNLFSGKTVLWNGEILLDMAIDIKLSLEKKYFIDTIYLKTTEGSSFSSIEVFERGSSELKKIGYYIMKKNEEIPLINIPVGFFASNLIIRVNGNYSDFGIDNLKIDAVSDLENVIYPPVENFNSQRGIFDLISSEIFAKDEIAFFGAHYLSECLLNRFNISKCVSKTQGNIEFINDNRTDDGFDIEVTPERCNLVAGTKLGFTYLVNVLISLFEKNGLKCVCIEDKPFMDLRGIHLALPERKNIPFFKKFIKELVVPMRYNTVFLQFSGAMQYDAFPDISKKWEEACKDYENGAKLRPAHYEFVGHNALSKEEVKDLCSYIKSFGIELVPEVQIWGHTQYITSVFPELSEVENCTVSDSLYDADARLKTDSAHCMCPSHKDYYSVVFKIIDEVIEVSKPNRFVHVGHDEIYDVAVCPKCKQIGAAKLFIQEVSTLNDYIKSKGLKLMMWADMLQEEKYETSLSIDIVPKDIILFDFTWYFHPEKDIEDKLLNKGFEVVLGNMYSSHFPRYETRSRKKGIVGAEVSTWVYCDEKSLSYEGKMFELIYSANMLWNKAYNSNLRLSYTEIIKPILWEMRKNLGDVSYSSSHSIDFTKTSYDSKINKKYSECSLENDIFEIDLNCDTKYISLLWATDKNAPRVMWEEPFSIGEITIELNDGSFVREDINYALNIFASSSCYGTPIPSFLFRHEGYIGTYYTKPHCLKTENGDDYTIGEHFIKIPAEKEVVKLKINHKKNTDAKIMLYGINYHK